MDENKCVELEKLQKLAEKIPSGVSDSDFEECVPSLLVKNLGDFRNSMVSEFSKYLSEELELFWNTFQIHEKLAKVKEIKHKRININDIDALKTKALKDTIRNIKSEIDSVKKESTEICSNIEDLKVTLKTQIDTLKSIINEKNGK